jgi:hypothetical protein
LTPSSFFSIGNVDMGFGAHHRDVKAKKEKRKKLVLA